jgi:CheY-like chemotaxis protein
VGVFYKNAEVKLLDRMDNIKEKAGRWKIAVFPASRMETPTKRKISSAKALAHIQGMAREHEISAYICHDSDIVLLFSNMKRNIEPALLDLITHLLPHFDRKNISPETAFEFYDLGVSFDEFYQKIREKISGKPSVPDEDFIVDDLPDAAEVPNWSDKDYAQALVEREARTKPLVVIIDDDEFIRGLARFVLRPTYHVLTAPDAASGLELINQQAPELIMLDIQMPGLDGISALRLIIKHMPNAMVLMFSARSTESNIKSAMQLGAKGFITKPFTATTLLAYAQQLLPPKT